MIFGPLYTVHGYSWISDLVSELGAQNTRNNFIMILSFEALGLGIAIDGVRNFRRALLPFILFGLFMAVAGLFPHKPLSEQLPYSALVHTFHSAFATLAGIAITVGFVWQGLVSRQRVVCFILAGVSFVFPLLMLALPPVQGLIQRLMYAAVFAWMFAMYPRETAVSGRVDVKGGDPVTSEEHSP